MSIAREAVQHLSPAYFGMIMATGIVSIAAHLLGMTVLAASTFEMAKAMDLKFLEVIPEYFIYVALLAWLAVFTGLVRSLARFLAAGREQHQASDPSGLRK